MKGVSLIPSSCPWSINWRRWHICKSASSLATIHVIWGFKVQEIAVWFVRLQFSVQYGLQKPPYQSCPPTVIHSCISLMTFLERAKAFSCLTAGQVREPAQTKKEWAEDREWAEKQLPLLFSSHECSSWGEWANTGDRTAPFLKGISLGYHDRTMNTSPWTLKRLLRNNSKFKLLVFNYYIE